MLYAPLDFPLDLDEGQSMGNGLAQATRRLSAACPAEQVRLLQRPQPTSTANVCSPSGCTPGYRAAEFFTLSRSVLCP